eukprot:jgi/Galph1/369/GphlegSOOS_G5051.1
MAEFIKKRNQKLRQQRLKQWIDRITGGINLSVVDKQQLGKDMKLLEERQQMFSEELAAEIQRCKSRGGISGRGISYREHFILQLQEQYGVSPEVVIGQFVQQVKSTSKVYAEAATKHLRRNHQEAALDEISNLLRFHRQWIKPAMLELTDHDPVALQTLSSLLNIRDTFELRNRLVQYSVIDIYRLYLEKYFSTVGREHTRSYEMENLKALQMYLGLKVEEALTSEEYVAGQIYRKAAVKTFENGTFLREGLKQLAELEKFLGVILNWERSRAIYLEAAKPCVLQQLRNILRDQEITLQQAIAHLQFLVG